MAAHGMSRIVRIALSALTAALILATAVAPFASPGIEARGKERRGHGPRQEQVQRQAKERGNTKQGGRHVASASKKRNKRKGNRIGNPRKGANPRHDAPARITDNATSLPPTLDESGPGLPDDYNTLYKIRTFRADTVCRKDGNDEFLASYPYLPCGPVYERSFETPTPVILAVAPDSLACGGAFALVLAMGEDDQEYALVPKTSPADVYTVPDITSYMIVVAGTGACSQDAFAGYPVSATITERTPNRNAILRP